MTRDRFPGARLAILRDKRRTTELLILLELASRRPSRLRDVAGSLGITVQAVSEYLLRMAESGLVRRVPGGIRATHEGVRFLHEGFRELRSSLDREMESLPIVESTDAVAKVRLRAGQRVGLFMQDGQLVADTRPSSSEGTASAGAQPGDPVAVEDLTGIVELRPGRITAVVLPAGAGTGRAAPDPAALRAGVRAVRADRIGAMGTRAVAAARSLKMRVDLEFAVPLAATAAALRGLDVMVLLPPDGLPELELAVETANRAAEERIALRVVHAGAGRRKPDPLGRQRRR